ncbi:MAG: hypothetical protein GF341_10200 [candidate division Zixibacteria bacterium]|nr:hypothetical protein [candidate division Zixibacteria bacterium]
MHIRRFALIAVLTLSAVTIEAGVPTSINVQGRLTDSNGTPFIAGPRVMTFKIYDSAIDGTEIWPGGIGETQSVLVDPDGLWSTRIGAIMPLTSSVFADSVCWLEIIVDDGADVRTTLPRIRLVTGPYAQRVATVDGATGGTIMSPISIEGTVATTVRTTDSNTTLGADDSVLLVSDSLIVTLPVAASCAGRQYVIKKISTAGTTLIVTSPGSGDLIDGETELKHSIQYQSTTLVSDGVRNWFVID